MAQPFQSNPDSDKTLVQQVGDRLRQSGIQHARRTLKGKALADDQPTRDKMAKWLVEEIGPCIASGELTAKLLADGAKDAVAEYRGSMLTWSSKEHAPSRTRKVRGPSF